MNSTPPTDSTGSGDTPPKDPFPPPDPTSYPPPDPTTYPPPDTATYPPPDTATYPPPDTATYPPPPDPGFPPPPIGDPGEDDTPDDYGGPKGAPDAPPPGPTVTPLGPGLPPPLGDKGPIVGVPPAAPPASHRPGTGHGGAFGLPGEGQAHPAGGGAARTLIAGRRIFGCSAPLVAGAVVVALTVGIVGAIWLHGRSSSISTASISGSSSTSHRYPGTMHVDLKDVTNSVAIGKGFDSNILGACIQKDAQGHQSYSVSGSALSIFLTNYKKPGKFPVGKDPASGSQLDANLRVPGQAFASGVANSGSLTITDLKNGTFELDFEKVALSKNGGLPTSGVTVHASGWFKFFTCP